MWGTDLVPSSSSGFSRGCESARAGVSKTSYPLFVILGEQSENAKIISTQTVFSWTWIKYPRAVNRPFFILCQLPIVLGCAV